MTQDRKTGIAPASIGAQAALERRRASRVLKRIAPLLALAILLLALSRDASAQSVVYAKVDGAKVRADTSATSAVVAEAAKGTELRVLERAGTRYKVSVPGGQTGYISRLHVSETRPESGGGLLSGLGRSEVRANEAEAVASIRGLSPAAKEMARREEASEKYIEWAELMETRSGEVSAREAEEFLKAGGIGL